MQTKDLLALLTSKPWRIRRSVNGCAGDLISTYSGELNFKYIDAGTYLYEEVGELVTTSEVLNTSRRYIYKVHNNKLEVYFEEQRLFYVLEMTQYPRFGVEHQCESDLYKGRFEFTKVDWKTIWHVSGPNKEYSITSSFLPQF